jgi:hypothetical protein
VKLKERTSSTPEYSRVLFKNLDSCPKKSSVSFKKRASPPPDGPRMGHKKRVDGFTDDTNFPSSRRDEIGTQVTAPLQSRFVEVCCQTNGFPVLQNNQFGPEDTASMPSRNSRVSLKKRHSCPSVNEESKDVP